MSPVRERTLCFEEVSPGDALPELKIPLTRTLIVATAIASRDYQDVHHDPGLAVSRGSQDIFMNILTTNGFVGRYVTDWAGPGAIITDVSIRLGAPNYPGDTMVFTGKVEKVSPGPEDDQGNDGASRRGHVEVAVRGANSRGDHVTGTVGLTLPLRDGVPSRAGGAEVGEAESTSSGKEPS
jgi:3-oxo-4,17-pregnadiene-20-carboxyl-CoA hydratase beta subunit